MTEEQAEFYITHMEEVLDEEFKLNVQVDTVTEKGILIKDENSNAYHFLNLENAQDYYKKISHVK